MKIFVFRRALLACALAAAALAVASGTTLGLKTDPGSPHPVFVVDGSNVHDAGELRIHVGNWGLFGSQPTANAPYSHAPSAEWPAGSGVEHLYGAGLWIGAIRGGIVSVSTSFYEFEFRPTDDPRDVIYRAREGVRGGRRAPHPRADDDGDGLVDEDWLNGRDDDGDGRIDEDFAAISDQMFSFWYTDDQPSATQIYPQHKPLNLHVRQESYAWRHPRFDDIVAVHYRITNAGDESLADVCAGIFMDPDVGRRDEPASYEDDNVGRNTLPDGGTDLVYAWDADGDQGRTTSYFGVLLLRAAGGGSERHAWDTFAHFAGSASFRQRGDPTNDFERYELMSSRVIQRGSQVPRDYRALMSAGPFESLAPGETLDFIVAFVAGEGLDGLLANVAEARTLYANDWYTHRPAGPPAGRIHLADGNPNPFNPTTQIAFTIPEAARVRLAVYDVRGRLVETLADGVQPVGTHDVQWNAAGVASGVYFCHLEALGERLTRRIVLLK